MDTFYMVEYNNEKVFKSWDDAAQFDFKENPEYHGYEEVSYMRCEEIIFEVDWTDLTATQQASILEEDGDKVYAAD